MTIIQSITSPVPLFPCQLWDEASIIIRVPLWDWSKPFSLYYWYIANLHGSDFLSFPPSLLPCQVFLGLLLLFSCCVPTCVSLFVTLWTAARQAPLTMGFSSQEYWSGLPCPPPGDLPDPGTDPMPLTTEPRQHLDFSRRILSTHFQPPSLKGHISIDLSHWIYATL